MSAIIDVFGRFLKHLTSITVFDIIDIAIVSVIFYYVFKFISDRRAGRLSVGVVFVLF